MHFLKKNLKFIIGMLVGAVLACGITVYANNILASQITYTNNKTVEQALNELYEKKEYVSDEITTTQTGIEINTLSFTPSKVFLYSITSNVGFMVIIDSNGCTVWLTNVPTPGRLDGYTYNNTELGNITSNGFNLPTIGAGTYKWVALK